MASRAELQDWLPVGRGSGFVFKKGQQFRFERAGFRSDVFSSLPEANRLGWIQYRSWCRQQTRGAKLRHANQAARQRPAMPRLGKKRRASDLEAYSTDRPDVQHHGGSRDSASAAQAAATKLPSPALHRSKKTRTTDTPAAATAAAVALPRNKNGADAATAAAVCATPARAAMPPEGAGSNSGSGASTAAAAVAAAIAIDPSFPSSLAVWRPGSSTESGKQLQLWFEETLGRGGFGEVHKVSVKVYGPNSLSTLKLRGKAGAAVRQLLASIESTTAISSRSSSSQAPSSSSTAGAAAGAGNSITMALKLAPPFIFTSWEMQQTHNHDAQHYHQHVTRRMLGEFNIMQRCAASPYIVNAFIAGTVSHYGTHLPAFLMEFAPHGDVEQAFLAQKLPNPWGLADQHQHSSAVALPGQQQQQESVLRGLSSTLTQRIVRAAALGLRDLHQMAGYLHCDIKTNNLLVFGDAGSPVIKLCDMGLCKRRCKELTRGPVSGTKDWQAPEQFSAAGGPLDFCVDTWGLGLLVLGLRRGRRPFWWLQEVGVIPAEFAPSLAASLGRRDNRYAQEDAHQPGSALGSLEVSFVQHCMAHSTVRQQPGVLLQTNPYLSGRYRGG